MGHWCHGGKVRIKLLKVMSLQQSIEVVAQFADVD
jgi:hypothetical protein